MNRRTMLSSFLTLGALTATGCGNFRLGSSGLPGSASAKPFKVLMVQDLSGALASLGNAEVQGMKASASVINSQGGILGRQVQVDAVDDQADPTKAVSLLTERITSGDIPDVVQGGTGSNETLAMLPIMTKNKIIYIGQNGADKINNPQAYPYAFSVNLPSSATVEVVVKYCQKKGYQKVGLLANSSASGQSELALFNTMFKSAGISITAQNFESTSLDLTPQLEALKAQGPDVLVTDTAFGRPAFTLLQGRQKLGWNIPTVGDAALAAQDLAQSLGMDALKNVYYAVFTVQKWVAPEQRTPAFNTFFDALKQQGGIKTSVNVYSFSYDELQVLSTAAKQAKSTEIPELAAALESLHAPNPVPWVTFPRVIFSKNDHFNSIPPDEAQIVIPAGPIIDGMFK